MTKERNAELRQMYENGFTFDEFVKLSGEEKSFIYNLIGESTINGFREGLKITNDSIVESFRNVVKDLMKSVQQHDE